MNPGGLRLLMGADPSLLTVARAFVASSLRALGYPDQLVDDLRLAVSELATVLVIADRTGPITIELNTDGESPEIFVSSYGALPALAEDLRVLVGKLSGNGLKTEERRWVLTIP